MLHVEGLCIYVITFQPASDSVTFTVADADGKTITVTTNEVAIRDQQGFMRMVGLKGMNGTAIRVQWPTVHQQQHLEEAVAEDKLDAIIKHFKKKDHVVGPQTKTEVVEYLCLRNKFCSII